MEPEAATPYETMRYDPAWPLEEGAVPGLARFARHRARLERSCAFTGVPLDIAAVSLALADAVSGSRVPLRVRLALSRSGVPSVTTEPLGSPYPEGFADTPAQAVAYAGPGPWPELALATELVDETAQARGHKTTDRALYEHGRPFAPANGLAEVAFLNGRGEVVEGAVSNVYVGTVRELLTPPLTSGALPGVLRAELIDTGLVREGVLDEAALRAAPVVLISSSVRGLRRVSVASGRVSIVP